MAENINNNNTKSGSSRGIAALILALVSIGCMVLAVIPMESVRDTGIRLSGWINVVFSGLAFVFAIAAIVAGAVTPKKAGTRPASAKCGMIFGALALIISVFINIGTCMISLITDYANNGDDSLLGQSVKDDPVRKAELEDLMNKLFNGKLSDEVSDTSTASDTGASGDTDAQSDTSAPSDSSAQSDADTAESGASVQD